MDRKFYQGNVPLKIDIRKAFDTLDWEFFIHTFQDFGFSEIFRIWILTILRSAKLSILVHGSIVGYTR